MAIRKASLAPYGIKCCISSALTDTLVNARSGAAAPVVVAAAAVQVLWHLQEVQGKIDFGKGQGRFKKLQDTRVFLLPRAEANLHQLTMQMKINLEK